MHRSVLNSVPVNLCVKIIDGNNYIVTGNFVAGFFGKNHALYPPHVVFSKIIIVIIR